MRKAVTEHIERLPPCSDCPENATIKMKRLGFWVNLCKDCYKKHFYDGKLPPDIKDWKGASEYGKRISAEIRHKIALFAAQPIDKSWAKRILDRHKEGEHVPVHALYCALEVAGDAPAPTVPEERQPGED